MGNCCNTTIDLGCIASCDDVVTNITATCEGTYIIRYEFNGATVVDSFYQGSVGYVTIPAGVLNENYNGFVKVYDAHGAFIACFKYTMSPTVSASHMPTYSTALTTEFTIADDIQCTAGVPDAELTIALTLTFSDVSGLADGSTFELAAVTDPTQTVFFSTITAGASITGSTLTIDDASLITTAGIEISAVIIFTNCVDAIGQETTISIGCVSDLAADYIAGEQATITTIYTG